MTAAGDGARVALVTGASRGIGRATAVRLAREGWRVVALARSVKSLESLDDEIRVGGGPAATLTPLDLKDHGAIDHLAAVLFERFGRLDGLAACAGVLTDLTSVFDLKPAALEETLSVNLVANARLIRAMDPLLRRSDAGRAVFVTSNAARAPRAYWGAYAASKAGLEALVACYAAEVGFTGMRVNLFDPGPTATRMRAKAFPGEDQNALPSADDRAALLTTLLSAAEVRHGERIAAPRACSDRMESANRVGTCSDSKG